MEIKFLNDRVKIDGATYKVCYSKSPSAYESESGLPDGTITTYSTSSSNFPSVDGIITNGYMMHIKPGNARYFQALTAYNMQQESMECLHKTQHHE